MTPPRVVLRIDEEELAKAVLDVVGGLPGDAPRAIAWAVVARAKARGSLDADFEAEVST
jgi:hypothetical protein